MTDRPITPPPELVQAWSDEALTASEMFEVKMKFAAFAAQWGYEQHERELLDAMHAIVPQPYEPEVDEHGYPLKLGDFYAS
jgi:hypothetical protein